MAKEGRQAEARGASWVCGGADIRSVTFLCFAILLSLHGPGASPALGQYPIPSIPQSNAPVSVLPSSSLPLPSTFGAPPASYGAPVAPTAAAPTGVPPGVYPSGSGPYPAPPSLAAPGGVYPGASPAGIDPFATLRPNTAPASTSANWYPTPGTAYPTNPGIYPMNQVPTATAPTSASPYGTGWPATGYPPMPGATYGAPAPYGAPGGYYNPGSTIVPNGMVPVAGSSGWYPSGATATSAPPPGYYPAAGYPTYPTGGYPGGTYPGSWAADPWGTSGWGVQPTTTSSWGTWNGTGPLIANPTAYTSSRCCLGPRFRYTWISGDDDPESLQQHDGDVSLVLHVPQFLGCTQPLYIVPSFSIHLLDGPTKPTADLPGQLYSAFVDLGWESDPNLTMGFDLGLRTGVFSDFDTLVSDSYRIMGKAFGRLRLTPNCTARAGIYYIDRNRYVLIPAGGILWTPNPNSRIDVFFPEPKIEQYLSTWGTNDVWWYATGYYGGGAWTVTRASGEEDRIDINDWRVAVGIEWGRNDQIRRGQRVGFIEGGYVFNRELLFKTRTEDNTDLEDAFVVRIGFGY